MAGRTEQYTARHFLCVTTHAATLDLTTHAQAPQSGYGTATANEGMRPCRAIHVLTAGAGRLDVKKLNGTTESITGIGDNTYLTIQAVKIHPNSDFTSLIVYW